MTVKQPSASDSPAAVWSAQAFGLSLSADFKMPGLPSSGVEGEAGRSCDLFLRSNLDLEGNWDVDGFERVFELPDNDGRLVCTLDFREGAGARIWGRERGSFFIGPDGSSVRCYPEDSPDPWEWRRFLVGQVLPHAALLQGLEILHASGVAIDDGALVFAGPSRAGKSSVAAHLVLRGAALVADDVVSIERRGSAVIANPGTPMIGLRDEERVLWSEAELELLGVPVAQLGTELLVAPRSMSRPCPLRSLYLLNRSSLEGPVSFEEVPDPRYLLASTFNNVLRTRDRLVRMLDVYSELSRSARVFRLNIPPSMTAAGVAAAVYDHHRAAGKAGWKPG